MRILQERNNRLTEQRTSPKVDRGVIPGEELSMESGIVTELSVTSGFGSPTVVMPVQKGTGFVRE